MSNNLENITKRWKGIKASSGFRNFLIFLIFIVLSTFFWLIIAMNDSAQGTFDVRINIIGVPDSVTFINDPPASIHLTVRDKGTRLFRAQMQKPKLNINFRDFASGNTLRFSHSDLNGALKSIFGPSAQIITTSLDSLMLSYSKEPGKRVPIVVNTNVQAASGKVISGIPSSNVKSVLLYSTTVDLDTISHVYTKTLVRRKLKETAEVEISIRPIKGVKIVPARVKITIPVEPLVKKTAMIPIHIRNAQQGYSILLFPDNVEVSYFVPMSRFNDKIEDFEISADFSQANASSSGKQAVKIERTPAGVFNASLKIDSVEYTIIK